MDARTEAKMRMRLAKVVQGKTLVLITHRSSLMVMVDRIVILDEGMIKADGPKEQILEALKTGQIEV